MKHDFVHLLCYTCVVYNVLFYNGKYLMELASNFFAKKKKKLVYLHLQFEDSPLGFFFFFFIKAKGKGSQKL